MLSRSNFGFLEWSCHKLNFAFWEGLLGMVFLHSEKGFPKVKVQNTLPKTFFGNMFQKSHSEKHVPKLVFRYSIF